MAVNLPFRTSNSDTSLVGRMRELLWSGRRARLCRGDFQRGSKNDARRDTGIVRSLGADVCVECRKHTRGISGRKVIAGRWARRRAIYGDWRLARYVRHSARNRR